MAEIEIVKARATHICSIARRMRRQDVEEVAAMSGNDPWQALSFSLNKSSHAWTVLIDGEPELMFGVGDINILAGVAAPWLLGTDAVEKNFRVFLRRSIDFRDQLLSRYPVMRNFVDERNKVSRRWLTWLGATFSDPIELNGHPFRLFELRSADV